MKFDNILASRSNKTIYRDGDLVIKVFEEGYSKADILNEALNHARVEETDLQIPKLREVSKVDGKWAIFTKFIPGKRLSTLMEENPDKMNEYVETLVRLQLMVHEQSCPLLGRLKDKMHRKISQSAFGATTRYELHTRMEGMPKHNKLCHGDFHPKNIIIAEDNTAYILDWAHATQGNASADVARTYLLFHLQGMEEFAEKYLDTFCVLSDTAKQYIQKWIPIVAAAQSVEQNENEKELLSAWVNVMDFE